MSKTKWRDWLFFWWPHSTYVVLFCSRGAQTGYSIPASMPLLTLKVSLHIYVFLQLFWKNLGIQTVDEAIEAVKSLEPYRARKFAFKRGARYTSLPSPPHHHTHTHKTSLYTRRILICKPVYKAIMQVWSTCSLCCWKTCDRLNYLQSESPVQQVWHICILAPVLAWHRYSLANGCYLILLANNRDPWSASSPTPTPGLAPFK